MRPRKPNSHSNSKPSVGASLRDAIARNEAKANADEQQRAAAAKSSLETKLSNWFNGVAVDMRKQVSMVAHLAEIGEVVEPINYSVNEFVLKGISGVKLETLDGFKKLDETCKELDVECTVTSGRHGYGRKAHAGESYLHVDIDVTKPYSALKVETPKPHGRRFR